MSNTPKKISNLSNIHYSEKTLKLCPDSIRNYLLNAKHPMPVLLKGMLLENENNWKSLQYSNQQWKDLLGSEEIFVRMPKTMCYKVILDKPQWEADCHRVKMSIDEFFCQIPQTSDNCSNPSDPKWAYFDYHYMKDIGDDKISSDFLSWSPFGFSNKGVKDSTLWIGTKGANTPCHIDTYGCNIVAQIRGKKRWTLFPMDQAEYLYPTRIPYEESSIYSSVGFPNPCIIKHSKLQNTTPHVVTLEAGDALLVPKHWWHFVECLEFCMSINMWVECEDDLQDRKKEAVVMYQVANICNSLHEDDFDLCMQLLNPNMHHLLTTSPQQLLWSVLNALSENPSDRKKFALTECKCHHVLKKPPYSCIHIIKPISFSNYIAMLGIKGSSHSCEIEDHTQCTSNTEDINFKSKKVYALAFALTQSSIIDKIHSALNEKLKE